MNVREFMRARRGEAGEIDRVAAEAGTTVAYLHQLAGGHRLPSPKLALALERASGGAMSRYDLRPDLYPREEQPA